MLRRCILIIVLICIPVFLFGQEEKLVERTVLVLNPMNISDNPEEFDYIGGLVSDTLSIGLNSLGYSVIDGAEWRPAVETENPEENNFLDQNWVLDFAASLGADVLVNGMFRVEDQDILIAVKAYDIFTRRIAVAATKLGPAGLGIYDTIDETAETVAGRIRETLKPLPESVITVEREKIKVETKIVEELIEVDKSIKVSFYSPDDGAEIYLGGEKLLGTIEDGRFEYFTSPNTVLDVTLEKEGFQPQEMRVEIQRSNFGVWLDPLYSDTKWDLSFFLSLPQIFSLGAQYRYHFISNRVCAYGDGTFSYFPETFRFEEVQEFSRAVLDLKISAGIGWYPASKPSAPLRFMFGLGVVNDFYLITSTLKLGYSFMYEFVTRFDLNFPKSSLFIMPRVYPPPQYSSNKGWSDVDALFKFDIGMTLKR